MSGSKSEPFHGRTGIAAYQGTQGGPHGKEDPRRRMRRDCHSGESFLLRERIKWGTQCKAAPMYGQGRGSGNKKYETALSGRSLNG